MVTRVRISDSLEAATAAVIPTSKKQAAIFRVKLKLVFLTALCAAAVCAQTGENDHSAAPTVLVALAAGDDNAGARDEQTGAQVLQRFLELAPKNLVRGAVMDVAFIAQLPRLRKEGSLQARRMVGTGGEVVYSDVRAQGDTTIRKDVIARFMSAETENALRSGDDISLSPKNYKFKYKGLQTKESREVYVYELNPRKKRVGLFKGELWLDPATYLPVRESGKMVKSPSIFLKKVEFTRDYDIRDGVSVPRETRTAIETRFWGQADLAIHYSNFEWTARAQSNAVPDHGPR